MLKFSPQIETKAADVGEFIAQERESLRWTQAQVAGAIGINRRTVGNVEATAHAQVDVLVALLETIGYDLVITKRKSFRR